MDNYFHFNTIRKTTIRFLDVFNNIKIAKYNEEGIITKYVTVPLIYAPKQKFYHWIYTRKKEKRLPMISGYITAITPTVNERGTNKDIKIPSCDGTSYHKSLIPYTIDYQLAISSLYHNELDQILEQIMPYFTPYVMIRVNIPEIDNYFDCKVILTNVTPDVGIEIPEDNYRTINWTLDFTVHTYTIQPLTDTKQIENMYLHLKNKDNGGLYETIHLSGYKDESSQIISNYEIIQGDE